MGAGKHERGAPDIIFINVQKREKLMCQPWTIYSFFDVGKHGNGGKHGKRWKTWKIVENRKTMENCGKHGKRWKTWKIVENMENGGKRWKTWKIFSCFPCFPPFSSVFQAFSISHI